MTEFMAYIYSPRDHQLHLLRSRGFVAAAQAEHALRKAAKRRFPHLRLTPKRNGKSGEIGLHAVDDREIGRIVCRPTGHAHADLERIIRERIQTYRKTGQP